MSAESQSEKIWQYAMRPASVIGDARNAPLNVANDASGDGGNGGGDAMTTADFSEDFGSIPSQFHFHGLAPSQSQSQAPWQVIEKSALEAVSGTESQKENMQLGIPSGSQSPITPTSSSNPTFHTADTRKKLIAGANKDPSSHVTGHVTSASPARAEATLPSTDSIIGPAPFSPGSAPFINKESDSAARATPLKLNNKAVTFLSPTVPPSPLPPIPTKTMPPRINRYAPRDVHPSSQDSFAGPPPVQDLNQAARSSLILSNTFIRTNASGGVEAVYHRPPYFSTSGSEPAGVMSISQSEHTADGRTASQVFEAAFDPTLSPPRPNPVVLVKDSQSQSQSHSDPQSQGSNQSQDPDVSSASASFHLASPEHELIPTQPNEDILNEIDIQPTQPSTQPADIAPPLDATHPSTGPSPLPVPAYRRRQFAALEAARLRARDEIVPETPLSTAAPSVAPPPTHQANSPSKRGAAAHTEAKVSNPGPKPVRGDEKDQDPPAGQKAPATRPISKGKGAIAQAVTATSRGMRRTVGRQPELAPEPKAVLASVGPTKHVPSDSEVVPDSQEEEQQQQQQVAQMRPTEGEIVPDSQEEEQQVIIAVAAVPSSPAVPLMDRRWRRNQREESPTPAAVRSPLRKGRLPEGITHARGRPSDAKGKGKAVVGRDNGARDVKGKGKAVAVENEDHPSNANVKGKVKAIAMENENDVDSPAKEDTESMELDKEQPPAEVPPPARTSRAKRASTRSVKKEKRKNTPVPTSRKGTKKGAAKATFAATAPTPGPSTRSKKRKSNTSDPDKDNRGTPASSGPPSKRQRKTQPPATPAPVSSMASLTRVFARRADKSGYYFPATVTVFGSTGSLRASSVFRVTFDDGMEDDIDVKFMRRFELEIHDTIHVKWPARNKDCAAVVSSERWDVELVEVQQQDTGPDGADFEVSSAHISIPEVHIDSQFIERRISPRMLRGDEDFDVPIPSPPANQRLAGMGFIITLQELSREKESLHKLIARSGGAVYEEWKSLISIHGQLEANGRRMVVTKDNVRMKEDLPSSLFCLTNAERSTPKYLMALALGVPCLSLRWVSERVVQPMDQLRDDWPAYILPAGSNPITGLPASQAFDRAWWRKGGNLPTLVSDPPIFKPFTDRKFLCFGTKDFCFDRIQKELSIIPKLLLAMGASYVEAVTDVSVVKKPPVAFDYTVVDDGERHLEYQSSHAVDVYWIKKCLLTGVEGPVPWPDS